MNEYHQIIAKNLGLTEVQVFNVVLLLEEGASIPFIARYRKEMSGGLNEIQIMQIRDELHRLKEIDKRRDYILKTIEEQGKLNEELQKKIFAAKSLNELEDLYLPYKPKRKTKATKAREQGLEPLAKQLMVQTHSDVESLADRYINPAKEVHSREEALEGARNIIAEWVNEHSYTRKKLRRLFENRAFLKSQVAKNKEQQGIKYKMYFDYSEKISAAASHRILAIFRGEKEKILRVKIEPDAQQAMTILSNIFIKADNASSQQVAMALIDSYKRLLQPSLETEMRAMLKEKADKKAIEVFAGNVRQLLMSPPLGAKRVLALDPGFTSGCKLVVLDEYGNLKHNETIYPHPPKNEVRQSANKLKTLVNSYAIEAIAIGNGTGGRETENFVRKIRFDRDVMAIMVNESGASVYSASKVAREEFPNYDVTVRGAVSIGRRLQDPLAELVKIDPKSIGVGQYQHDVNQKQLMQSLHDTVMSVVNAVGVQVNTASKQLLAYVSGIGNTLAENIVQYRSEHGAFESRQDLMKVPRMGAKVFEQAAGFLRIRNAANPLDGSAVHPESYPIVEQMAKSLGVSIGELIAQKDLQKKINIEDFVTDKTGLPTLEDIMKELAKPGRDPREDFSVFQFSNDINRIEDLKAGMQVPGIITNITAFGAFVDIGVHQDGLIHKSQMAEKYVHDPAEYVSLNQKVNVVITEVDIVRKRISLSMKGVQQ